MTEQELAKFTSAACFDGLSTGQMDAVVACARVRQFAANAVVFEESSQSTDMYVLLSGRVCVEIDAPGQGGDGHEHLQLAVLRDPEVFGEIAFLEGRRRSARIVALDDVSLVCLDGPRLHALFDEQPRLGYQVVTNLARILSQRVVDINFKWRQDRGAHPFAAAEMVSREVRLPLAR